MCRSASAQPGIAVVQTYSSWHLFPNRQDVYYCSYFYRSPQTACFRYDYMVWYKGTKVCYYYSTETKEYTGCWYWGKNATTQAIEWSFGTAVSIGQNAGKLPTDVQFNAGTTPIPAIPGGTDAMTPPDLPPV